MVIFASCKNRGWKERLRVGYQARAARIAATLQVAHHHQPLCLSPKHAQAAISLPTPQGTPYRTPSTHSKSSRRSVTPPRKGASPSRMTNGEKASKRSSRDVTTDEHISILDPRRFTPTLHANLVSEILTLRRDQEEKTKQIESLEAALQTGREEQETLQANVTTTSKEARSLQRQLSLLEGGTSSALSELSRERDEAVDSVSDTRKRLEIAQKKIRTQEEDSQRVHDLWAQDKDAWEDEKRKYERKLHVAESRLKIVLDEVATYQTNQANGSAQNGHESEGEESGRENDALSVRTMSLTNSVRFSMANGAGSLVPNGHSLADELNFDDTDDQTTDVEGRESVLSSPRHKRTFSRDSVMGKLHRRNQSMESLKRPGSVVRGRLFMNQAVLETLEGEDEGAEKPSETAPAPAPKATYTDTGIQYSPPPSPKLEPVKPVSLEPRTDNEKTDKLSVLESSPRSSEIEANQRKKRVSLPLTIEPLSLAQRMVSSASQTIELPLSPPKTPNTPYHNYVSTPTEMEPPTVTHELPVMVMSSTQTDTPSPTPRVLSPPPPPLAIPSINIQPPTSRPSTPPTPRLPQQFKDFGCQVKLSVEIETVDSSCQTDSIQTDKRMALLPPHLQPSSISSRPASPIPSGVANPDKNFTPVPGNLPPRNPRRLQGSKNSNDLASSPISNPLDDDELQEDYPGNDDGPLSSQRQAPMRRPRRYSSLYSGFCTDSDEVDEFGDADISDSEFRTALSAPRPHSNLSRQVKRSSIGTDAASPDYTSSKRSSRSSAKPISTEIYGSYSVGEKEFKSARSSRSYEKPASSVSGRSSRVSVMRRAAMIQSGIVSHRARSRSPSLIDPNNPPFPIPTRASSRKPSISISIPSDGRSSPSTTSWHRRSGSRTFYNNVRRVRSANTLPRHTRNHHGSGGSPPLSPSTEAAESPGLPPLPKNDITTPRNRDGGSAFKRHRHEHSNNTVMTTNTEAMSQASSQAPGVVDAIAQTMVGEWMFKYVRRRKSFGVPDANRDETSNDRHKRWVWLAPYERAILWSSKQPSSGSALLGKSGRKLTIQSVLDVKDDNPPPKGVTTPVFNRSILILTPQRALKFTAPNAERHYLWLTALSFLAHSSQAIPDILAPPTLSVKQQPLPEFEAPRPKFRRGGIRDSIRLAKGRTVGPKTETSSIPSIPSIPSVPSSRMGDVASFRVTEPSVISSTHTREISADAAEPPMIPRFHDRLTPTISHGRKRSNTGGHVPPPLSFRGFSGPILTAPIHPSNSLANMSVGTTGSSDNYMSQGSTNASWVMAQTPASTVSSHPGNFFDAIGTVRMEAFISPLSHSQDEEFPDEEVEYRHLARRRSKDLRRRQSRSRRRDQYSRGGRSSDDFFGGNKTAGEEDFFLPDDPFKGF